MSTNLLSHQKIHLEENCKFWTERGLEGRAVVGSLPLPEWKFVGLGRCMRRHDVKQHEGDIWLAHSIALKSCQEEPTHSASRQRQNLQIRHISCCSTLSSFCNDNGYALKWMPAIFFPLKLCFSDTEPLYILKGFVPLQTHFKLSWPFSQTYAKSLLLARAAQASAIPRHRVARTHLFCFFICLQPQLVVD